MPMFGKARKPGNIKAYDIGIGDLIRIEIDPFQLLRDETERSVTRLLITEVLQQ